MSKHLSEKYMEKVFIVDNIRKQEKFVAVFRLRYDKIGSDRNK